MAFADWIKRNFGQGSWLDEVLKRFDQNTLGGLVGELKGSIPDISKSITGSGQTTATVEAQQHQDMREDTMYQRTVADMKAAGINPMMAASGGTSAQSVTPQSGSASLSELFQLALLGPQQKLMEAQADNLKAGAEEKRAKAPYWTQRIEESIEKIKTYKASAEKDIALAVLNRAKAKTEDELREYEKSLKVSLRACADAEAALKQEQASETVVRKGLEAAQKVYQEQLNDEDMAKKVCAKIVAETGLAGANASKAEQEKISFELSNAMVRGDFVEVCIEQLRKSGHDQKNAAHIASQALAIFKNILGMINVSI